MLEDIRAAAYGRIAAMVDTGGFSKADMLLACVHESWRWMESHALGNEDLDPYTTFEEFINGLSEHLKPRGAVIRRNISSLTIRLDNSFWRIFELLDSDIQGKSRIRIAFDMGAKGLQFQPLTCSAGMIEEIDSCILEFRKMSVEVPLEIRKANVIMRIKKISQK